MKNVHLVPTDKPSRLHITSKLDLYPNGVSRKPQGLCKNQHIYITTDEEVKEGDWFLEKAGRQYPIQWNGVDKLNYHCKKIILTTDQSLDGVQAIDDEFLEWFVKNPTCESVEVEEVYPLNCCIKKEGKTKMNNGCMERNRCLSYKIIIPQEEPKQETMYTYDELRRIAYNAYCFGQFEGTTEGKFNKWIVEFKK